MAGTVVPAIETIALRKVYGHKVAVDTLDLVVQPGEVFGFLGPNGAGKTTTVKILIGLVKASSGEARICGLPVGTAGARRRIGYLPENFRFHDWLTGEELLDFHGRLAGLSSSERHSRTRELLRLVGLEGRGGDRIRSYSKGMAQRIGLAQALIHRPDVVLLDEPTSALDPIGRREVRDIIRALREDGMTVLLNSHLLSEVEMVCDQVAIVDKGRIVRSGRLEELVQGVSELRVTLDRVDSELFALGCRFGEVQAIDRRTIAVRVPDLALAPALNEALVRSGYQVYGLVPVQQSLEDLFVQLVERSGP